MPYGLSYLGELKEGSNICVFNNRFVTVSKTQQSVLIVKMDCKCFID